MPRRLVPFYCRPILSFYIVMCSVCMLLVASPIYSQSQDVIEIAVALSLSGEGESFGQPALEGIQFAVDEANANGQTPSITLTVYDDQASDDEATAIARRVVDSPAWMVLGPVFSTISLAAGPIYAEANMVSLPPTATSDLITQNDTTFRVIFKNSDQGETLANYLVRVLGKRTASVVVIDSGYGSTLQEGFQRADDQLGIEAEYYLLRDEAQEADIVAQIAERAPNEPVVFLTLDPEGARMIEGLRKLGVNGPFLGGDAFGDEAFNANFDDTPEQQRQPGYFTQNVYGLAPIILDSANAEGLAFAQRFRARFGHDPVWQTVAGYDAARLAVEAVRTVAAENPGADIQTRRTAVYDFLRSLDTPALALPGILGPVWFDTERARPQAIRVGRFFDGRFESAPLQIVSVSQPDTTEIASGAVFEMGEGRYGRLQRVIYSGVFLNEIQRVDLPRASFNADFYLWLRFAENAGPDAADPTDLIFPNMIGGDFNREEPAEQREMPDGTQYWLWRIQGEFRNDFDLRLFPFDMQTLQLPFTNKTAPMERIVYVVDKRSSDVMIDSQVELASPIAFRNLSQWDALSVGARRENLVTDSALGNPTRTGVESQRELSGFLVTIEIERRSLATLSKSLLPLLLVTLIMFASLYFPAALVKEKVTVAITGALSGAVLLTAINTQLGSVGYTIAVEYIFYIFFVLCLLCIISVLVCERLRASNRLKALDFTQQFTRFLFLFVAVVTVGGMVYLLTT